MLIVILQSTNTDNIKNYKPVNALLSPTATHSPAIILPSFCPSRLPLSTPLFNLLSITIYFLSLLLLYMKRVKTNTSFPVRHSSCYIPYEYRVLCSVMLRQCCHNNKSPAISLFQRYIARQNEVFSVSCSYPPFLFRRKHYFLSFMLTSSFSL